jgi:predicted O-methyltransferase YrrM
MSCSLNDPAVARTLARLHEAADVNDPAVLANVHGEWAKSGGAPSEGAAAHLLDEAFISVSPEAGRLLYILTRAANAKSIVEFGTSFGISTIYLASAARDNGGRVITTELNAGKARKAAEHLAEAGLSEHVEIRQGDALETLRDLSAVEFLLLDGWKNLYLPVLRVVEPKLGARGLVVADDLDLFPEVHKPYLEYIRDPQNGYLSVEVPMGDRLDVAVRVG